MKTLILSVCLIASCETVLASVQIKPGSDKPAGVYWDYNSQHRKLTSWSEMVVYGDETLSWVNWWENDQSLSTIDVDWGQYTGGSGSTLSTSSYQNMSRSGQYSCQNQFVFKVNGEQSTDAQTGDCGNTNRVAGLPIVWLEHCDVSGPKFEMMGPPAWWNDFTEGASGSSYTRHADTTVKLRTGGKAVPGRQNLWQINCTASKVLNPYAEPGQSPPLGDIPSQSISILGHSEGNAGYVFVLLPNGADKDITPQVSGQTFYTLGIDAEEYHPYITANDVDLDNGTPEFCVGLMVNFSLRWTAWNWAEGWHSVSRPPNVMDTLQHWTLPGNYYNAEITPCSTCSTDPFIDYDLLTNETVTAWWVSGGTPATYAASMWQNLHFSNGQYVRVAADGKFSMFRPQVTVSTVIGMVALDSNFNGNAYYLHDGLLGSSGLGAGIRLSGTIALGDCSGGTEWVPVIDNTLRELQKADGSGSWWKIQSAHVFDDPGLPAVSNDPNSAWDSPAQNLNGWQRVSISDSFSTWLMFTPTGGHSVPLKVVVWSWNGVGALSGGTWSGSGHNSNPSVSDTQIYPSWTDYKSNVMTPQPE